MNMGFMGSLSWVNAIGRKKCRSLFCRMRAALKKAIKNSKKKRKFSFQYDPSSYALNFDDGRWKYEEGGACALRCPSKLQEDSDINNTLWVCVYWPSLSDVDKRELDLLFLLVNESFGYCEKR